MDINNKVVLIYGGTSGIGKELTRTLISKGAFVLFTGKSKEKGESLASTLRYKYLYEKARSFSLIQVFAFLKSSQEQAVFYQCDVTDWEAQQEMYNVAKRHFNGKTVDIVVMVAGILDSSDLLNNDHQEEQEGTYRTLQVNLTAAVKANRLAIQHFLRENKPGCIINTSSIYGFCGAPLAPMYSATKHALIGLTKSYGSLLKPTNIRVNAVAPSFIETPMLSAPAQPTAAAMGYVSMTSCIDAYIKIIEDSSLNGDILIITSNDNAGLSLTPIKTNTFERTLDELSEARKSSYRNQLMSYFQSR